MSVDDQYLVLWLNSLVTVPSALLTNSLLELSDGHTLTDIVRALQGRWLTISPAAPDSRILVLEDSLQWLADTFGSTSFPDEIRECRTTATLVRTGDTHTIAALVQYLKSRFDECEMLSDRSSPARLYGGMTSLFLLHDHGAQRRRAGSASRSQAESSARGAMLTQQPRTLGPRPGQRPSKASEASTGSAQEAATSKSSDLYREGAEDAYEGRRTLDMEPSMNITRANATMIVHPAGKEKDKLVRDESLESAAKHAQHIADLKAAAAEVVNRRHSVSSAAKVTQPVVVPRVPEVDRAGRGRRRSEHQQQAQQQPQQQQQALPVRSTALSRLRAEAATVAYEFQQQPQSEPFIAAVTEAVAGAPHWNPSTIVGVLAGNRERARSSTHGRQSDVLQLSPAKAKRTSIDDERAADLLEGAQRAVIARARILQPAVLALAATENLPLLNAAAEGGSSGGAAGRPGLRLGSLVDPSYHPRIAMPVAPPVSRTVVGSPQPVVRRTAIPRAASPEPVWIEEQQAVAAVQRQGSGQGTGQGAGQVGSGVPTHPVRLQAQQGSPSAITDKHRTLLRWLRDLSIDVTFDGRASYCGADGLSQRATTASWLGLHDSPDSDDVFSLSPRGVGVSTPGDFVALLADGVMLSEIVAQVELRAGNRLPVSRVRVAGVGADSVPGSGAASVVGAGGVRGGAGRAGSVNTQGTGTGGRVIVVLPGTVLPRDGAISGTAANKNLELALTVLRQRPKVPARHIWQANALGDLVGVPVHALTPAAVDLAWGLVEDIYKAYGSITSKVQAAARSAPPAVKQPAPAPAAPPAAGTAGAGDSSVSPSRRSSTAPVPLIAPIPIPAASRRASIAASQAPPPAPAAVVQVGAVSRQAVVHLAAMAADVRATAAALQSGDVLLMSPTLEAHGTGTAASQGGGGGGVGGMQLQRARFVLPSAGTLHSVQLTAPVPTAGAQRAVRGAIPAAVSGAAVAVDARRASTGTAVGTGGSTRVLRQRAGTLLPPLHAPLPVPADVLPFLPVTAALFPSGLHSSEAALAMDDDPLEARADILSASAVPPPHGRKVRMGHSLLYGLRPCTEEGKAHVRLWVHELGLAPLLPLNDSALKRLHPLDDPLTNGVLLSEIMRRVEPTLSPLGPHQQPALGGEVDVPAWSPYFVPYAHPRSIGEARANVHAGLTMLRAAVARSQGLMRGHHRHHHHHHDTVVRFAPQAPLLALFTRSFLYCTQELLTGNEDAGWGLLSRLTAAYPLAPTPPPVVVQGEVEESVRPGKGAATTPPVHKLVLPPLPTSSGAHADTGRAHRAQIARVCRPHPNGTQSLTSVSVATPVSGPAPRQEGGAGVGLPTGSIGTVQGHTSSPRPSLPGLAMKEAAVMAWLASLGLARHIEAQAPATISPAGDVDSSYDGVDMVLGVGPAHSGHFADGYGHRHGPASPGRRVAHALGAQGTLALTLDDVLGPLCDGTLLGALALLFTGKPVPGLEAYPRTEGVARANVRKALSALCSLHGMPLARLTAAGVEDAVFTGATKECLDLLSDLAVYFATHHIRGTLAGMGLRLGRHPAWLSALRVGANGRGLGWPSTPSQTQQYPDSESVTPQSVSPPATPAGGRSPTPPRRGELEVDTEAYADLVHRRAHRGASPGHGPGGVPVELDPFFDTSPGWEDKVDTAVILTWLASLGVRPAHPEQLRQDAGEGPAADWSDGVLLAAIVSACENLRGVNRSPEKLHGIDRAPASGGARLANIRRALEVLRDMPSMPIELLWSELDLRAGAPLVWRRLLCQMRKAYGHHLGGHYHVDMGALVDGALAAAGAGRSPSATPRRPALA